VPPPRPSAAACLLRWHQRRKCPSGPPCQAMAAAKVLHVAYGSCLPVSLSQIASKSLQLPSPVLPCLECHATHSQKGQCYYVVQLEKTAHTMIFMPHTDVSDIHITHTSLLYHTYHIYTHNVYIYILYHTYNTMCIPEL
jgi:hypothetical protein